MTVQDLLAESTARLEAASLAYGHGTTGPRDEAAWLMLWQLQWPLDTDLIDTGSSLLNQHQIEQVRLLIDRRIRTRKPAAYLTREAWLQGVAFYVDERTIVPRSFIAELMVDGSIDPWLSDATRQVLDLCTGNASLAVLAAMAWPDIEITGADISTEALAVARINTERHGLSERIRLLESDGLAACDGPWDLILCNPPYVNATSMSALPAEYLAEPALALAGGIDGMDFIRHLLQDAPSRMNSRAVLVLEIGNERGHFEKAFPKLEVVWLSCSAGDDQVLLVTRESMQAWASTEAAAP